MKDLEDKYKERVNKLDEKGLDGYKRSNMDWIQLGTEPFQIRNGYSSLLTNAYLF